MRRRPSPVRRWPIALNNQGFAKREFRAALGLVRLAESSFTGIAYLSAGLFTMTSVSLVPWIVPSVAIGVPIGAQIIKRMRPETFRRICMSFDAWVVAFGLSKLLRDLAVIQSAAAYSVLAVVAIIDIWMLSRFFGRGEDGQRNDVHQEPAPSLVSTSDVRSL